MNTIASWIVRQSQAISVSLAPRAHHARFALYLTVGLLPLILAALWSASIQSVFAQTPSHTSTDTSQNSKAPTVPNCGPDWTLVPSPNVGSGTNYLKDVSAVSASDVWAVGNYSSSSASRTLIELWNGTGWNAVTSPNLGLNDNYLAAVDAVSASDVWAVVSSPNPNSTYTSFLVITAVSASDVWATGNYLYSEGITRTIIEHWDGVAWTVVASPNVGVSHNILVGVTAVSANDVWAVGYYQSGNTGTRTLIMQWDGSAWNAIASPNAGPEYNYLRDVVALSANDIWAVGHYLGENSDQTLIERWNGSAWSRVTSPSTGSNPLLTGVTAVSANDVWAVGSYEQFPVVSTLIERYNPCVPSPTPTATIPPTQTPGGPTATPVACTIEFTDVPPGSTFYDFVRCMACRGIINGYTSGCETGNPCFRPSNNVTRGQLSKIVANAAGFSETVGAQQYEDVPPGSTFFDFVWRLANRGYVSGYACGGPGEPCVPPDNLPYFRPNSNATRGQISKIVSNAAGFIDPAGSQIFEDVPPSSTFFDFIQRLASRGVMSGYACGGAGEPCNPPDNRPYFRPASLATRGQTSKIVANTFFPACNTPSR
jgi:hypothetical protein